MASSVFSDFTYIAKTATPGVYRAINASTAAAYTVTDTADSPSDNTAILGDITNDKFTVANTTSYRGTQNQIFVGSTTNGASFVSREVSKRNGYLYFVYGNTAYAQGATISATPGASFALCFASGTRIMTTSGDVAVEKLRVGQTALSATGVARQIVWIGQRRLLAAEGACLPDHLNPVRVRAGAFGAALPSRDVLLSPGHPVLCQGDEDGGGVLIPIMCLINGTSVAREACSDITYWHVELEKHDILLADGLPAESYFDLGCRGFFDGSDDPLQNPDLAPPGSSARCRPVHVDGPIVDQTRTQLDLGFSARLNSHCDWQTDAEAILAA